MTAQEVKAMHHMCDIVGRYGLKLNRSGFICCPFHDDKVPSMKVYRDKFHCFSCGAHGDVFDFVMRMDDVSFKEAFQSLGGEYQKPTFSSRMAIYHSRKQRVMRQKEMERFREKMRLNSMLISIYRSYMERSEPFSDVWCDCYNALQYELYVQAELSGLEARW